MSDASSSAPMMREASSRARLMQSPLPRSNKRRRVETDKESEVGEAPDERKRLACPFFKRKPTTTRPSCVYPGFSSIARLKEHLYRQHMLPENLCPRCLESFKSEADLREHSRARSPCLLDTETHIEGITRDQEKVLKSKKRTSKSGVITNEEKWRDIFMILFPGESIPDPFCKTIGTEDLMRDTLSAVKRDLPEFVAQRLKNVSSELFPFNLEDPIPRITQIVSDSLDRLIPDQIFTDMVSDYRAERSPDSSAFQSSPDVICPSDTLFPAFGPIEEDTNESTAGNHSPSVWENNAYHQTDDPFDITL